MSDVVIYTTPYCPFCWRAKGLLEKKSVEYEEIDVSADAEARRRMMERAGGHTVPQIFIGERHVGGCDELYELDFDGELDTMLGARP
jgi:glutaredoxin 3